jgi:hypothetical protein
MIDPRRRFAWRLLPYKLNQLQRRRYLLRSFRFTLNRRSGGLAVTSR